MLPLRNRKFFGVTRNWGAELQERQLCMILSSELKVATLVGVLLSLYGCAYSIKDVDVSGLESSCVRECSKSYSSCVSQGNQVGF